MVSFHILVLVLLVGAATARMIPDEAFMKAMHRSNRGTCSNAEIVSRAEWDARAPRIEVGLSPVSKVFIHHSVTAVCASKSACSATMRSMQNYHMDVEGWFDIGYNMVVGTDTRTYVGRGFETEGAHTGFHNPTSLGICVIGDFTNIVPSLTIQQKVRDTIDCAIEAGQLSADYELFGHRDAKCTACPGDRFYADIITWPEYSTRDIEYECG